MASSFRGVLDFFDKMGLFDVVLPFLLVFSIIFAILEKTKVLGTEEIDGKKFPRRNLNAMVAFSISFLVIASAELVEILTAVSSRMVIFLFLSVFFLLLVGSFYKEGEPVFLEGGWKTTFTFIMFAGIIAVFLSAVKTPSGETWLDRIGRFITGSNDEVIGSIVLLGIAVAFISFILKEPKQSTAKH